MEATPNSTAPILTGTVRGFPSISVEMNAVKSSPASVKEGLCGVKSISETYCGLKLREFASFDEVVCQALKSATLVVLQRAKEEPEVTRSL